MCRRHGRKLMWFGMIHTGAWRVFNALRLYIFKRFCCCVNQPTVKMNVIFIEPTVCIFQICDCFTQGQQVLDNPLIACWKFCVCFTQDQMVWDESRCVEKLVDMGQWSEIQSGRVLLWWLGMKSSWYIYILLDFISWLFSYSLVVVYEHLHWGWQFWTLGSTDWMIYTWVSEWLKLDDWNCIHPRMTKRELELKGAYWKGPIILTMFTNPVLLWTAGSGSEKELVAAASVLASKGSPA